MVVMYMLQKHHMALKLDRKRQIYQKIRKEDSSGVKYTRLGLRTSEKERGRFTLRGSVWMKYLKITSLFMEWTFNCVPERRALCKTHLERQEQTYIGRSDGGRILCRLTPKSDC